jgi:hypothetical protein
MTRQMLSRLFIEASLHQFIQRFFHLFILNARASRK